MTETTSAHTTPFHAGEREAQRRAGVARQAAASGSFIRDYMPEQHREFFSSLPFLVMAAGDDEGRPWVTLLEGEEGFIDTPNARTLAMTASLGRDDPLASALHAGADVGLLGIELATRRRNRLNGAVRSTDGCLMLEVQQSFGNCPQYIHEREWQRVAPVTVPEATVSEALDAGQRARIETADTFFIGSAFAGNETDEAAGGVPRSRGYDASHRGGEPGFVRVTERGTLQFPDYPGNNFFNTLGNLIRDPRVGLAFVDFETGGLLQMTGRACIDWAPQQTHDPNAKRLIEVTVEQVVDRPGALSLRWWQAQAPLQLKVVDRVVESDRITSFYLADAGGGALPSFQAGQYLPIELDVPGQPGLVRRSYSLSGAPQGGGWRLSIKREEHGIASRFLHDTVTIGDRIAARPPSGDFVLPRDSRPVVLVSAGVGITPMLSMLHALVAERDARPVWFVHGARNGAAHAFREEVEALVAASGETTAAKTATGPIKHRIFYSAPEANDRPGEDYDAEGRITAEALLALGAGSESHYLLCGPARFLAELSADLEAGGVPSECIEFETFGPAG
ncbi:pyridoxamine 5'-phosphate oxidase family protein [Kushneria phosphatilytica]|uniref:Ferredoxin n=1 Tax=Kushneria phosphatilytica TaxID=657387 RepID=A0A1S1NZS7_9GAMM|nr:pyridoxamine 5'-phosphate oxidase family protein [Kushneria phosphatilytica]OHV13902.1 ferredoxin [Kushneria phosphatilytica]QEL10463.1 ferredoxin [Kushneria phosphatilytica]